MGWISREVRDRVRLSSGNRCGYCHAPQFLVLGPLEIDHLLPVNDGGSDEEDNLWLACSVCNSHKARKTLVCDPQSGVAVRLFNPRVDPWEEHFVWGPSGNILVALSACGRATIAALHMNCSDQVNLRAVWVDGNRFPPSLDPRLD